MKRGILWVFMLVIGTAAGLMAEPQPTTTQGVFAVELATRLGLGQGSILEEINAIDALSRIGIRPDAGWSVSGPATELFVVQIQKSIHILLQNVSRDLSVPVPPTLNLQVVSTEPFGGQTIFFEPRDFQAIAPPPEAPSDGPEAPKPSEKPKP